ncbi:hypothetical protein [Nonomuraea typhae]|uniref:hypothetical protein n=1 Tax=Nonomuraea typhae TaxID=2603600 RepID=UPI0012FAE368|nr:hypothetical protein [Nonomuraea typhae]
MRIRTTLVAALLAVPLIATPAHAAGKITCDPLDRRLDLPAPYTVVGRNCFGTGVQDVEVIGLSGSATGRHLCKWALYDVLRRSLIGAACNPL